MSVFSPARDFGRGIKAYMDGVRWLKAHPKYLGVLFIPMVIGVLFLAGGLTLFSMYDDRILALVLFKKPEPWYYLVLFYICQVLLYVAVLILTFLVSFLLMNIVASPFYEIVSTAVERDVTGSDPPKLSFSEQVAVMLGELQKVALILTVTILVLFIPGLNVLSSVIAAFLVGWDFFDYPLARRGWPLTKRLGFLRAEIFAVLGLGIWLVIPFVQIVMLPLAVAGGTLLSLDALQRRKLITPSPYLKETP